MILIEAHSIGRPFVATRVGHVRDLAVSDDELVPVDDPRALAAALLNFLSNPELARKVGVMGQRRCAATQSIEVVDRTWRELYRDALAGRG
jgi:glycosyltransferase involved in cell wall biosynthesis